MWVRSLGRENPLGEEVAIQPSILAWEMSWTVESVAYSAWGRKRDGHDLVTKLNQTKSYKRGKDKTMSQQEKCLLLEDKESNEYMKANVTLAFKDEKDSAKWAGQWGPKQEGRVEVSKTASY